MTRTVIAAMVAVGVTALAMHATAVAQTQRLPDFRNDKLIIDYIEPEDPKFLNLSLEVPANKKRYDTLHAHFEAMTDIYQRIKKRRLLEEFSYFLAPLRLPVTLRVRARQCSPKLNQILGPSGENAYFTSEDISLNLCYEYVRKFDRLAARGDRPDFITRPEALIGAVVSTMLHEAGHAVFYLLQIPLLGREEDAADQIAAYIMLQFGRDVARTTIKGAAWKWFASGGSALWGEHSTPPQRLGTYLCLAYGKDPAGFQDFVDVGWLPKYRSGGCKREYAQVEHAFGSTMRPHIDEDMMKKVLARPWLRPDELN
jgi:hypothetical protein